MKAIVIGCGRVGSAVAQQLQASGWDVTVCDENEDALGRLGEQWTGGFLVGHGMDFQLLREAGSRRPTRSSSTTDGDNTNLVIAQVAQKQFEVPTVIVRVLDPARAQFYATRGLRIVCPTSAAIETLVSAVRKPKKRPSDVRPDRRRRQGRREPHALAAARGPRGDARRAAARTGSTSWRPSSSTR